jgi:hypothetical protein
MQHFRPKYVYNKQYHQDEIDLQTSELNQWIKHSSHAEPRDMHVEQQALIRSHEEVAKSTRHNHALLEEIMRVVMTLPSNFQELKERAGSDRG